MHVLRYGGEKECDSEKTSQIANWKSQMRFAVTSKMLVLRSSWKLAAGTDSDCLQSTPATDDSIDTLVERLLPMRELDIMDFP
jgi:hypothetical protein